MSRDDRIHEVHVDPMNTDADTALPALSPRSRASSTPRRALLGGALVTVAAGTALIGAAPATADGGADDTDGVDRGGGPHGRRQRERAERAVTAMSTYFAAPTDPDQLTEFHPPEDEDPEFTYCWPLSQARAAVTELGYSYAKPPRALRRLRRALTRAQEQYWYPEGGTTGLPAYTAATDSEHGANGDIYYDDNAWVVLLETEELLITKGRRGHLARARELVDLARSGEDTDQAKPYPGGIFWAQFTEGRNTVSTVPNAKAALRLHQLTGEKSYFEDALRWIEWTREALLSPDDGLFWDNIGEDGSYDETFWAYNQGVPLGAEALLYEITGERKYRHRALELYDAIVEHYALFDGGEGLDDEPTQFAAILTANLVMAESIIGPRLAGRRIARRYADVLWEQRRDPATDLYDGERREDEERLTLLDQAGFARALAIAALPSGIAPHLG